jgi:hypothetical protein
MRVSFALVALTLVLSACGSSKSEKKSEHKSGATEQAPAVKLEGVPRSDFNRIAAELYLPLFWTTDEQAPGELGVNELAVVWGFGEQDRAAWVKDGRPTARLIAAHGAIAKVHASGHGMDNLDEAERARREVLREELSQGRPTLVHTSLKDVPEAERIAVRHIMSAAKLVEQLYQRQSGAFGLDEKLADGDTLGRMVFFRNQGPWCAAPLTENNEACHALPERAERIAGLYPADVQTKGFCQALEKKKNAKELMDHFAVVAKNDKGDLVAVPYPQAFAEDTAAVAAELRAAAAALPDDEDAFKEYLEAAAQGFVDNNWEPANEKWVAMNANNSKWYLRVGPDEVYYDPCAWKAGFHMSFARINPDSLAWQEKLDPHKQDMEDVLAKLAGKPYQARQVAFQLPDFIDIVLNAGNARSNLGGTVGQSLPNWGPVSEAGGRTVAMTNLYTDPDSRVAMKDQQASLFCKATFERANIDETTVLSTVLHEAAHNLGPSHDYKVKGKTAPQVFGGPLASMLEELKAQTSALYFVNWLQDKEVLDEKAADQELVRNVAWGFGHISTGLYTADGRPKAYSQLASIQLGTFLKNGGLVFQADERAANGEDTGCFELTDKLRANIDGLQAQVLKIKGSGAKADAHKLVKDFVDDEGEWSKRRELIRERWLRAPKASFVYAIE